MTNSKRPTIRGRGADIFLTQPSRHPADEKSEHPEIETSKATFHLPISLLERLDGYWLDLRRNQRITKSEIVRTALESHLAKPVSTGNPDGTPSKNPDVAT